MGDKRREKQKEKKRMFQNELKLDSKNAFGITDRTPMQAINNMIDKKREAKRNE